MILLSHKERNRRISAAIAEELQVPPTQVANDIHIEFFGKNQSVTEGCLGVLEYDNGRIVINTVCGIIAYSGSLLEICSYSDGLIEIHGNIESVQFT